MDSSKIPIKEIPTIPVDEWDKIVVESDSANKILNSPDFVFLINYLKKAKESAINLVATNTIKDVVETTSDSKTGYSKSVKTTKEEQLNEISGCIKFIDKLFADLETLSKQKDEYLKLSDEGKVVIEVSKEDKNAK